MAASATREAFYVGGHYVQDDSGKHTMQGQMYVEHLTSSLVKEVKPHPIVFVHGATRTGAVSPTLWVINQPLHLLIGTTGLAHQARRQPWLG